MKAYPKPRGVVKPGGGSRVRISFDVGALNPEDVFANQGSML
jgi:hypothetical protein